MGKTTTLHLVRHAKAGKRSTWTGDDEQRPLSTKGLSQAGALAEQLAPLGITAVLSSPALRCRQTVLPLAERLGTTVENVADLAEGRPPAGARDLLMVLPDDTVLSAHGDLIPALLRRLNADGMRLDGPPVSQKASVWAIDRRDGEFVVGRYTPPP